jgi:hypothetical protein
MAGASSPTAVQHEESKAARQVAVEILSSQRGHVLADLVGEAEDVGEGLPRCDLQESHSTACLMRSTPGSTVGDDIDIDTEQAL